MGPQKNSLGNTGLNIEQHYKSVRQRVAHGPQPGHGPNTCKQSNSFSFIVRFYVCHQSSDSSSSYSSSRASFPVVRGETFSWRSAQFGALGFPAPTATDAAPVGASAGTGSTAAAGICTKRQPGRWSSQRHP